MNKKLVKVFSMLLIVLMICSVSLSVFADKITPSSISGETSDVDVTSVSTIGNTAVKILQTVGVIVSVCVLIVLGIKYMMGSAEEKAEYKKTMMPYIIGALLIFAASSLAQFLYNIFNSITTQ